MKLAPILLALTLTVSAQTPQFTDPANLRGERVSASDGRELPIDTGARGLEQLLRKLNTRASIMNIVAHPDDEDGGMLTLYSRGLGARVADISLTRGEGGQNAVTGDFEDALGLLRTQELLANDRYTGVNQFFGTEVDFGFSKTKEESFAKWGHDRVLYDVVRAIRLYRPLVLTSTWIGGVTDGHGQHQVSGQVAQEAFLAAGDPKVFPELTAEGILPWQPLKIYARVPQQSITAQGLFDYATGQYTPAKFTNYVTGEVTTIEPTVDVVVHEGTTDPLLSDTGEPARSYVQFARIGLSQQKSQMGPGIRTAPSGTFDVGYHRYSSRLTTQPEHEDSFFDGIDTSIEGIATLAPEGPPIFREALGRLHAAIAGAAAHYNASHPAAIAPDLATALQQCKGLIGGVNDDTSNFTPTGKQNVLHELRIKEAQLTVALTLSLGLSLDAITTSASGDIPTGQPVPIKFTLSKSSIEPVYLEARALANAKGNGPDLNSDPGTALPASLDATLTLSAADANLVQRPYFHRGNIEQPTYDLDDPALRNAPQSIPSLTALAALVYNDTEIILPAIVHDGPQPIRFVPALSVSVSSHAQILPTPESSSTHFSVFLATNEPLSIHDVPTPPILQVKAPSGWLASPLPMPRMLPKPGVPAESAFSVSDPSGKFTPATLRVTANWRGLEPASEGYRPIGYGDLPRTNYFTPATDRVVPVDLKLPDARRIAYLPGTGDAVPEALASIGLPPTLLTVADLNPTNLANFDTVILGVRTYAAHPDLHGAPTQALLDYAKNGGNVVVQYQTGEFSSADAPYALALAPNVPQGTVVDETAPVQLLFAQSPAGASSKLLAQQDPPVPDAANTLLTTPNRITPADFDGWIEERGHGFLRTFDSHYTALTETHDPGQAPQRGGLITTQFGKGRWTYVAFALYRQLPEAVPGAYRLFVNLLAK